MTSSNATASNVDHEPSYLNPEQWKYKRAKFNVAATSHLVLRDIFDSLDLDRSGSINIQNFREAVNYVAEVSDLAFNAESLADFFESLDQDFSGTIDMKEFISGMISHPDSDEIIRTIQSLQVTFSSFANQLRRQKLYNHINVIDKLSVTAFSPKKTKSFFKTLNNDNGSSNNGKGNRSDGRIILPSNTNITENIKQNEYKRKLRNSCSNIDVATMDKYSDTNKRKEKDNNEYEESTVERIESKYKKDVNNAEHLRQKRIERERAHDAAVYFEGGPKISHLSVSDKNKNSTANTDKNRNFQDLMDLVGDDSMLSENNTEFIGFDSNSSSNCNSGGNSSGSNNSKDNISTVNKPNHIANSIHNVSGTNNNTINNGISDGINSGSNSVGAMFSKECTSIIDMTTSDNLEHNNNENTRYKINSSFYTNQNCTYDINCTNNGIDTDNNHNTDILTTAQLIPSTTTDSIQTIVVKAGVEFVELAMSNNLELFKRLLEELSRESAGLESLTCKMLQNCINIIFTVTARNRVNNTTIRDDLGNNIIFAKTSLDNQKTIENEWRNINNDTRSCVRKFRSILNSVLCSIHGKDSNKKVIVKENSYYEIEFQFKKFLDRFPTDSINFSELIGATSANIQLYKVDHPNYITWLNKNNNKVFVSHSATNNNENYTELDCSSDDDSDDNNSIDNDAIMDDWENSEALLANASPNSVDNIVAHNNNLARLSYPTRQQSAQAKVVSTPISTIAAVSDKTTTTFAQVEITQNELRRCAKKSIKHNKHTHISVTDFEKYKIRRNLSSVKDLERNRITAKYPDKYDKRVPKADPKPLSEQIDYNINYFDKFDKNMKPEYQKLSELFKLYPYLLAELLDLTNLKGLDASLCISKSGYFRVQLLEIMKSGITQLNKSAEYISAGLIACKDYINFIPEYLAFVFTELADIQKINESSGIALLNDWLNTCQKRRGVNIDAAVGKTNKVYWAEVQLFNILIKLKALPPDVYPCSGNGKLFSLTLLLNFNGSKGQRFHYDYNRNLWIYDDNDCESINKAFKYHGRSIFFNWSFKSQFMDVGVLRSMTGEVSRQQIEMYPMSLFVMEGDLAHAGPENVSGELIMRAFWYGDSCAGCRLTNIDFVMKSEDVYEYFYDNEIYNCDRTEFNEK